MRSSRTATEIALKLNWTRLFRYSIALTGNGDDAHDLLQQAALNALAARNAPDQHEGARAWLFKIVRNAWIDRYRRTRVRAEDDSSALIEDQSWSYEDRLIAEITVKQGLSMIDASQREIIELVDLWGFRYIDVATILEIPVGTVMSRLSRARLSLLEAIARGNVEPMKLLRAARK